MKRNLFSLVLVLCLMLGLAVSASAAESSGTCGDNLTWTLSGGKLTISGTGPMDDYVYLSGGSGEHPWSGAEEEITSLVIEEGVTYIGEYAFCDFTNLKTVTIPASVQGFGRCAFMDCASLTGPITIPEGVTEIPYRLFLGCNSLTGVTLPDSVTYIDGGAFQACYDLKAISIPAGVTDIGEAAFNGCELLTEVILPENLTVIRASLFGSCSGLKAIEIPEAVTVIQDMVFYGCTGLTEVTIPQNVTAILDEAFGKCTNLKSIRFTGAAPEIWENTFRDVTATVTYPGDLDNWDARANQNYGGTLTWNVYCSGVHNSVDGTVTQEPTCSEPGEKTGICDICGESYTRPIPAGGEHSFDEGAQTVDPTCTDRGIFTYTCTKCGATEETYLDALGHTNGELIHVDDSPYHKRVCAVCGVETVTGCTYDEGVLVQAASVNQRGITRYSCGVCGGSWEEEHIYRLYGDNRYATSIAIADAMKQELGVESFDAMIVASGLGFADALPGSYLAAVKNAPILVSNTHNEDTVAQYILENLSEGGTVYLLGGPSALPETMEEKLSGLNVVRLAGANRYETNLKILEAAGTGDEEILVCTGTGFADSLSASATGKPILLVGKALTDGQKAFLEGSSGKFVIIGGTGAVSEAIEEALTAYGTVTRLSGSNRYETSVEVAEYFFEAPKALVLAYGKNFPDGLCGGPLAYAAGAPLVLTTDQNYSTVLEYALTNGVESGAVLGGPGLIAEDVAMAVLGG